MKDMVDTAIITAPFDSLYILWRFDDTDDAVITAGILTNLARV